MRAQFRKFHCGAGMRTRSGKGRCRRSAWRGLGVTLAAAAAIVAAGGGEAFAERTYEYVRPVTNRINTTGRPLNLPVPVKDDGNPLGEIVVRIEPDDSILIPKAALVEQLSGAIDKAALARLHAIPDNQGQVSLADLRAAGFNVNFDPVTMELTFLPVADQRSGDLSLGRRSAPLYSSNAAKPAIMSGYLNVIGGADYRWGDVSGSAESSGRLDLVGVFRLWNIAVENEAAWEGSVDTLQCPAGAICTTQHQEGFKRQRSRLVYDLPEQEIRIQAGDADVYGTGLQRSPDVLGVSIEKSPRKLRPGESIRPTGRSSFRIERPSDVEVLINGAIVQKFRLRPGNYNLADLPLATGANEVQLIITDDSGERRSLSFTAFFDGSLLASGKSEWSVAGGLPSYFRDGERQYLSDETFGTGFYRHGITDQLTAEANLQGDSSVIMGGAGAFAITPWGLFGLQGALSESSRGYGWAANVSWDIVNFKGPFSYFSGLREAVRFGAEYRSSDYRMPGEFVTTADGILMPQFNYWLRLSAAYSMPIGDRISATLSGRYQFSDEDAIVLSPNTLKGDRYGADLTLSSVLGPSLSGGLTFGYSNETYYFRDTTDNDQAEFRVMGRLYWRPDDRTRVSAAYDTLTRETSISGYHGDGRGIGRWDTSIDVLSQGRDNRTTGTAAGNYYGNRLEARVQHTGGFSGLSETSLEPKPIDQRTSARIGTSFAFADGAFAVGPPIRGQGFAIVGPHESIADKTISVGTREEVRARADAFGPALVTDLPAYANATIPVDAEGLPIGYSLGTGTFETYAPYRAGYKLQVGSAYSVSTFGTLVTEDGDPVVLISGVATSADDPKKQVVVFTNASGRFGADGLAPGRWSIEMATDGRPTRYVLDVPPGTKGLFKAGTLKPSGGNVP